MQIAFAD